MEHLTKSQIVLLTLFVSFVSSMATGIVTVTLMQQAPAPITQSITNVVERTIEKVAPAVADTKPAKPTVIKDEDLVVAAIDRNTKSTVAFKVAGDDGGMHSAGVGVLVSSDGLVITDKGNTGGGILMTTVNGVSYALQVVSSNQDHTLILGRLVPTTGATSTSRGTFTPAVFGDPSVLKVGQTALVLGGRDGKTVVPGMITNLDIRTVSGKDGKSETKILENIGLSQRPSGVSSGAPIITLDGLVVGVLSVDETAGVQLGATAFEAKDLLAAYQQSAALTKTAR